MILDPAEPQQWPGALAALGLKPLSVGGILLYPCDGSGLWRPKPGFTEGSKARGTQLGNEGPILDGQTQCLWLPRRQRRV